MKIKIITLMLLDLFSVAVVNAGTDSGESSQKVTLVWQAGVDIETFWQQYADANGGLTWGKSTTYPEYEKVREGDTLLIQLAQGPCLMEFFHSRWRRANDVRRWDPSVNEYGGCPYVFD